MNISNLGKKLKKSLALALAASMALATFQFAVSAADDVAFINAAGYPTIEAAIAAANDGDTISIVADTYEITAQINIKKSISLVGDGTVVLDAADSFTGDQLIKITNDPTRLTDVSIENITFIGNEPSDSYPKHALDIVNSEVTLTGVTANNFRYGGINVNNSAVDMADVHTAGNRWYGIAIAVGSNGGTADYLNNLSVTATGVVTEESAGITIDNKAAKCDIDVSCANASGDAFVMIPAADGSIVWMNPSTPEASAMVAYIGTDAATAPHYASIEAAIAAAAEGDVVTIKEGTHTVAAEIKVNKSISLIGEGSVTLQADTAFAGNYLLTFAGDGSNGYARLTDLAIENITFIGNEPTDHVADNKPVYALNIVNSKADLTDITANNFRYGGINVNNSAVTANGLSTSGNRFYGVNVSSGTNSGDTTGFTAVGFVSQDEPFPVMVDANVSDADVVSITDMVEITIPGTTLIAWVYNDSDILTSVADITPSGTSEELAGSISVTFSDAMDTTVDGKIFLNGAAGNLSNGRWEDDVFVADYADLANGTTYEITVEDFVDANGNPIAVVAAGTFTFTTKAAAVQPGGQPNTGTPGSYKVKLSEDALITMEDENAPLGNPTDGFPFVDVPAGEWFRAAVEFVYDNGIFAGTSSTTFAPTTPMTRGMLVTVLYNLAGAPEADMAVPFTDVAADAYYAAPVAWAVANHITSGVSQTAFAPNANITREQLVTMLYSFAQSLGLVGEALEAEAFADDADISAWATEAVAWARANNIISGRPGNLFDPQATATRAEVASVFQGFTTMPVVINEAETVEAAENTEDTDNADTIEDTTENEADAADENAAE